MLSSGRALERRKPRGYRASLGSGSDGTRTRDLRRDSAALTKLNPLQNADFASERVRRPSPFCAAQRAASERMAPQAGFGR